MNGATGRERSHLALLALRRTPRWIAEKDRYPGAALLVTTRNAANHSED
jgi:hypothetical protein